MSLATPIERWTNRLFLQHEPSFAAASELPVREFTGKTRFSYAPVHGQGGSRVGLNRLRTSLNNGTLHWQAGVEAEYQHGALAAELFKTLFELVSEAANSPADGLTTYVFRLRRLTGMTTAKLGLEYEPTGPFYVMHGVVTDAIRLTATARNRAKLRADFKARQLEQIPSSRSYTHPDLTQYGQFNFLTETIGGPCYEDGPVGLSCRLLGGDTLLATEDDFVLTTEDGYALLLDSEAAQLEPQAGSAFNVTVNGEQMSATEISFEGRESKTPARFNPTLADVMKPGQPTATGELALYMTGPTIPEMVAENTMADVQMTADFGGGRTLTIAMPNVKFNAGTPDLVGKGELVYRVPFTVLETAEASTVTLVI